MPFISDAASAIKTRFGFQDPSSEPVRATPDIPKSSSRISHHHPSHSSAVGNDATIDECREGSNAAVSLRSFELPEDPSFWKEHNVQKCEMGAGRFGDIEFF
ncbi:hypothetical protein Ancab_007450 [Ancistrocladus abbreviatus]